MSGQNDSQARKDKLQSASDSMCGCVDSGVTLVEALMAKYDESQFQTDLTFFGVKTSSKLQERAGDHQPSDFRTRTTLPLDDCSIASAGPPGEIKAVCPNLEELDLSKNHLTDWKELFAIMSQLSRLQVLNCSCNNLCQEADIKALSEEFPLECCSTLRKLALNNTNISLDVVFLLLECFTGLEELFLSLNGYTYVPSSRKQFSSIKRLYLNNSEISEWSELDKMGETFPMLEELIMTDSSLENVKPASSSGDCAFPNLRSLVINRTMLNKWRDIEALNTFPSLRDVRLLGIPLLKGYSEKQGRQLLVANLPKIEMLNNSKISPKERESADRMFIRKFMDTDNPPRRYTELVAVHGVLDRLADVNLAPKKTAVVEICYEDLPPFKREISLTQTVLDFKKSLVDVVGVPPSGFRVFYYDSEAIEVFGAEELKGHVSKTYLHRYKVKDGDSFHIMKKDISKK